MTYFYARLFAAEPEISAMLPAVMDGQRHRFYRALRRLIVTRDDGLRLPRRARPSAPEIWGAPEEIA